MLQIFIFIAQRTRAGRSSLRTQGVCYNINIKQSNTLHVSKNRRQTQTDALRTTLLRLCLCDVFNRAEKQSVYYSNTICVVLLQKTATAVAYCKRGSGLLRVNGRPLDQIEPKVLQYKLQEPLLLLGKVSTAIISSVI